MRASEHFGLKNVAAGTYLVKPDGAGSNYLNGGDYLLDLICTGTPGFSLEMLGADGATWVVLLAYADATGLAGTPTVITAEGIYRYLRLPPGAYRIVITTSTANYVSLTRTPVSE